jgi:hypothetical protein
LLFSDFREELSLPEFFFDESFEDPSFDDPSFEELSFEELSFDEASFEKSSDLDLSSFFESELPLSAAGAWDLLA